MRTISFGFALLLSVCAANLLFGQDPIPGKNPENITAESTESQALLGPGDEIGVSVMGLKDILPTTPIRVSSGGDLNLPVIGTVHVEGLTSKQAEEAIRVKLTDVMREPEVSLRVTEYQSLPVSVLGAVATPGVKQVVGRKTLLEMISLAGGLKPDAGYQLKLVRELHWGSIPLPCARNTLDGKFSVCELNLQQLMDGTNPRDNIAVRPHDIISVPTAELIYVLGEVRKPGGFVLREKENMSVLQAIALAEGIATTASPNRARILHRVEGSQKREETVLNLSNILNGTNEDRGLQPNDILIVPPNVPRRAALRALETAVQLGTGVLIFRR
jgi:polysaccharide export outer membrane protein